MRSLKLGSLPSNYISVAPDLRGFRDTEKAPPDTNAGATAEILADDLLFYRCSLSAEER